MFKTLPRTFLNNNNKRECNYKISHWSHRSIVLEEIKIMCKQLIDSLLNLEIVKDKISRIYLNNGTHNKAKRQIEVERCRNNLRIQEKIQISKINFNHWKSKLSKIRNKNCTRRGVKNDLKEIIIRKNLYSNKGNCKLKVLRLRISKIICNNISKNSKEKIRDSRVQKKHSNLFNKNYYCNLKMKTPDNHKDLLNKNSNKIKNRELKMKKIKCSQDNQLKFHLFKY